MFKKLMSCRCAKSWSACAPLVLRVVVGLIFVAHGWQKVQMGNAGVAAFFGTIGIPAATFFAFIVTYVEFLGGIALILGVLTHWAAKLLMINMLVAFFVVHISKGVYLGNIGADIELLLAAATFAIMIMGPGKWALMKGGCKDGCCTSGDCGTCCTSGKCEDGVCKVETKQ
jgi:putative oxidoreductase